MKAPFFRRLYASYAALVLVTAAVIGLLVHQRIEAALNADIEQSLHTACALVSPHAALIFAGEVAQDPSQELSAVAEVTGIRLTLIRPDGEVLVDTHEDAAQMENHRTRPEILAAFASVEGLGLERRRSGTLGLQMLYVAQRLEREPGGVVRAALPMTAVEESLSGVRGRILLGTALGTGLALVLGLFMARRLTAPVREITRVADSYRAGRYESRARNLPDDELGRLGEALNELGASLAANLAKISKDDARLRAMLAGIVEAVIAVDDDDRIVFCNRTAGRLLGTERREAKGRSLVELKRIAGMDELLSLARESGRAATRNLVVSSEAREVFLQAQANPFEAEGERGVVAVLHDITELRRLESVRRDFVANVSHELKTPLTSIQGYVETLLDGALHDPENNERFLDKIHTHVRRLAHLVADLLSLARLEAQEEGLRPEPVDIAALVEAALRRHEMIARERQVECVAELEASGVLGDPEGLTQVIDNLLDNAIKYTPAGGRVTVRTRLEEDRVLLEVEDTGIGIPEADLERVFERFYRVDRARSRELGGTGLGLAIVKHLILAMDGELEVQSLEGAGSRFRVSLPAP